MATAATRTTSTMTTPTTEVPDFAQTAREQLLSAVKQGQQLSVDAAEAWVKAVSVLPTPELLKVPGVPAVPGVQALGTFSFDVAADLLDAQRDFAVKLADVLVPAQSL